MRTGISATDPTHSLGKSERKTQKETFTTPNLKQQQALAILQRRQ